MSVTTQRPGPPSKGAPPPQAKAAPEPPRRVPPARRRKAGASIGGLPVANLVVLEIGVAVGLGLLAVDTSLLPVAGGIVGVALILMFIRWSGRWFTQWVGLTLRYLLRSHTRATAPAESAAPLDEDGETKVIGAEDARVALLRLAVPDLVVAHTVDHERAPVGMAWQEGVWTAVLRVELEPQLVAPIGKAPNLPIGALAPCLEDRGVVLDSIRVLWHCYPGSTMLPPTTPAMSSYMEVIGALPTSARRTTLVAVRLDPRRCGAAIRERGGGVVGAHRALIGALSRVRSALEGRGVPTRPLAPDELLSTGIAIGELTGAVGAEGRVGLVEKWGGVTAAGVGHSSYSITGWPSGGVAAGLNAFTSIRALSSTVSLAISPGGQDGQVGLRGLVRISARTPAELGRAEDRLDKLSDQLGFAITPLRGLQTSALAATLPFGGWA
ncbi:type VII secretion protein EccE [Kutzneria sp. CA-103260]|uniref:type VII secretion protein EccE n=1 Tax=Kutzneria sp. CA-103260 TaxID=2802641 RepID=UPI001BA913A4|nr:type VII secretion protein EccE [Kutzneria sp. CA-103260]QUQ70666.1 type VII secretion protein EccE [Kutzneria sp. CA-103260]